MDEVQIPDSGLLEELKEKLVKRMCVTVPISTLEHQLRWQRKTRQKRHVKEKYFEEKKSFLMDIFWGMHLDKQKCELICNDVWYV